MIEIATSLSDTTYIELDDGLIEFIIARHKAGKPCEMYENLNGRVFLYADFDLNHEEDKTEAEHLKIINEQINLFCLMFQIDRKLAKVKIANKSRKTSFHIISKERSFDNPREIKDLIEEYELKFDKAVYSTAGKRQLFRLLYTTKQGENRPFIPVNSITLSPIAVSIEEYRDYLIYAGELIIENDEPEPEDEEGKEEQPEAEPMPDIPEDDIPEDEEYELIAEILKVFKAKKPEISTNNKFKKSENQGLNKLILYFRRLKPSFCLRCNREHTRDGTDILIYHRDTGAVYLGCCKENKTFERLTNEENQEAKQAERLTNRQVLKDILIEASSPSYVNELIEADKAEFKDAGFEPRPIDTSKFISEDENIKNEILQKKADIIAIKSPKGTGKTQLFILILTILDQISKADGYDGPKISVLLISSRISLAKKFVEELKGLGFEIYLDIKTRTIIFKHYRLAIQLDSLHRSEREIYDIVIIDEAHQLLEHFYSDSFLRQNNLDRNLNKFKRIIQRSKQILLLDANLKAENIEYIKNIRNIEFVRMATDREFKNAVVSLYYGVKTENSRTCKITDNEPGAIKMMIELIKEGKKIYTATNYSAGRVAALASMLKIYMDNPDRLLLITSKTIATEPVIKALDAVNTEFLNYDVIICSPSVQSGISFYVPNYIYQIFGLFCNLSANAIASTQMLGRVRNPINTELIVSIQMSNAYLIYKNPAEYFDYIRINRKHISKKSMEQVLIQIAGVCNIKYNKYDHIQLITNPFVCEIVDFKIKQSNEKKTFVRDFINLQVVEGIKCEYLDFDISQTEKKQIKQEFKDAKIRNDEKGAKEKAEAPNLRAEELKDINKRQRRNIADVSPEELIAKEKYYLKKVYGLPDILENETSFFFEYSPIAIQQIFQHRRIYCEGFVQGLKKIRDKEIKKEVSQNRLRETETMIYYYVREPGEAMVRSMLYVPKYQKHKKLLSLIDLLGFKTLNSDILIKKNDMMAGIKSFLQTQKDHKELVQILGKEQEKAKTLKTLGTNPRYLKIMIDFFNPSLMDEFGIKIKKTGNEYELIDLNNERFRTLEDEPAYYKGIYRPLITPYREI